MITFQDILQNRQKYKQKILTLPKSQLSKHKEFIKLFILPDEELIDSLVAAYFENVLGTQSPIKPKVKLPKFLIPKFEDDNDFFFYVSDHLKRMIS